MSAARPTLRPPPASSAAAAKRMRANHRRDSGPELALRRALHRRGLRFRVDLALHPPSGRAVHADVVFTRHRLAVFLDGCFWHGCPAHGTMPKSNRAYWRAKIAENQARDARNTTGLEDAGWTVLRLWEHVDAEEGAETVAEALAASEPKSG